MKINKTIQVDACDFCGKEVNSNYKCKMCGKLICSEHSKDFDLRDYSNVLHRVSVCIHCADEFKEVNDLETTISGLWNSRKALEAKSQNESAKLWDKINENRS